ncbi:MAG: hypothetical protein R3C16_07100 [Hyphomonadaceae bacterium]
MRAVLTALALCLALAPAADAQQARENGWSTRGVFVFGSYYFDFWRGVSGPAGSHMVSRLEDCSTSDYYCLREQWFSVVLPKRCGEIDVGDAWTVGATTTRVIARVPMTRGPHEIGYQDHALAVATDGNNAIFLLDAERGVQAIYQGWPFHTSAEALAAADRYSPQIARRDARAIALEGRLLDENNGFQPLTRVSPDLFGPCSP